ncbi:MAG: MFS transporter [Candidatus Bathyarchaeia archaeon]
MQRRLALMITLSFLSSLAMGLLAPIYPLFILNRFSVSVIDIGFLFTVFGFTSALFKVIAGKMVDVYGKERIFLAGVLIGAICSIAYIFASNIIQLYLLEFLFGVSYALEDPARLAMIAELGGRKRRGLMFGISESAYEIAGSIAALIATIIVSNFGFETVFIACSGCQIVSGFVIIGTLSKRF